MEKGERGVKKRKSREERKGMENGSKVRSLEWGGQRRKEKGREEERKREEKGARARKRERREEDKRE